MRANQVKSRNCGFIFWQSVLLFVSFLGLTNAHAAALMAEVDRETVIDGESVVLYISGSGLSDTPDTSPLLKSFRILQSGATRSESIVNGQRTRGFKLRLELQAKNTGPALIPAFTVDGVSSKPIGIDVVPRGTPGVEPRDKAFVELSVDNESPYVQEQVIVSLKIFDDGNLASADPNIVGNSDMQVERLPLSGEELEEKNGVRYRVHTFRYALFPQKSGELTIDSIAIPASIRDKSYGGNLILRNTPTRRIELRTEPLTLKVKPRAPANTSSWWLPVRSLELKHQWSEDIKDARVGEPFTRTFELAANGATSTQLPEIPVPDIPGLKIYSDTPQLASRPEQNSLVSVRQEKWSVIPNKAGLLTLPEIVIKWWDTSEDVEKRVVVPAQQLRVAGAISSDGEQSTPEPTVAMTDSTILPDGDVTDTNAQAAGQLNSGQLLAGGNTNAAHMVNRLWQWLALAAMAAWAATLLCWWWMTRKKPRAQSASHDGSVDESAAWKRVKALSRGQDITAYSAAVIDWAQVRWTNDPVHNLPEVGARLGSQELTNTMRHLDQKRYSGHQQTGAASLAQIQSLLESAVKNEHHHQPSQVTHALPQL